MLTVTSDTIPLIFAADSIVDVPSVNETTHRQSLTEKLDSIVSVHTRYEGIPRIKGFINGDFFFCFVIFVFLLFSLFNRAIKEYVIKNFELLSHFRRGDNINKSNPSQRIDFRHVLLVILSLSLLSPYILYMMSYLCFIDVGEYKVLPSCIVLFVLLSLFVIFKMLILRMLSLSFSGEYKSNLLYYYIWEIGATAVLGFIPIIITLFMGPFKIVGFILFVSIFLIFKYIMVIKVLQFFVGQNIGLFYFILYLCTFEIAPYFAFIKSAIWGVNYVSNILI